MQYENNYRIRPQVIFLVRTKKLRKQKNKQNYNIYKIFERRIQYIDPNKVVNWFCLNELPELDHKYAVITLSHDKEKQI